METIHSVTRSINRELVPLFEERLRAALATRDREWLIEQIVRLTLDAHSLEEMDRRVRREAELQLRRERHARVRELKLDPTVLADFLESYRDHDRPRLLREGHLLESVPPKGTSLIADAHRGPTGEALLLLAKDMLFGLLFGDEATGTRFERVEREILTLTIPRAKAVALNFMKATTELGGLGTWQDPDSVSDDARADNVILEVEYGDIGGEMIGAGIIRALSLINNLEVNEQILYARMINVEQSTLIE